MAKVKRFHPDYTYFEIYHYSQRTNNDLISRKKIQLFDNNEFKGSPLYELDNEKVVDFSSGEKKIFNYKDYFSYDAKSFSVKVRDMPFDFIRANIDGFSLGVLEHKGSISTVVSKDKKLYFKSSLKELLGDEVTYIVWPTNRELTEVKEYFLDQLKQNLSLQKIINPLRNCSEQRDIACLKLFLQSRDIEFPQDHYNILKVNRFFASKKISECNKHFRELSMKESDIYKKEYPEYIPWEFIKGAIALERGSISLERTVKKMINTEVLSIRVKGNVECLAEEKLQMLLEKNLSTNNWKLLSFNFADTLSDE